MNNYALRKYIRKVILEISNNTWEYIYGPDRFPKFDGEGKTPSDLDAEFNFLEDKLKEISEDK